MECKKQLLATSLALTLMGSIFADSGADPDSTTNQAMPTDEGYTPYYYNRNTSDFFVYADWIYWQPVVEDPMDWCNKFTLLSSVPTVTDDSDTRSLDYDYSSGFRVGAGYRFGQNYLDQNIRPWQIEAMYTRLHTAESGSAEARGLISASPGSVYEQLLRRLVPTLNDRFEDTALQGNSRVHLEYDRVDVEFAWPIWMKSNVILRLMTGATFAWFENNWTTRFSDMIATSPSAVDPTSSTKTELEWNWWGGGLFGGGDIYMSIGKGFGFFANSSFALLFGPMEEKEEYSTFSTITGHFTEDADFTYHFTSFQPVVNFGAGIDYKHWFKDKVMLHMSLGWDFTWWFDMNQFGRVNERGSHLATVGQYFDDTEPTDLGFQGLTARLGFDF